jgi:hypothetical protein
MKRIDIEHGRWSYRDNKCYTQKQIEDWFVGAIYDEIHKRLQVTDGFTVCEKNVLKCIDNRLKDILLARPPKLEAFRRYYNLLKKGLSCKKEYYEKQKDKNGNSLPSKYSVFRDHLLNVFGYEKRYRSSVLRELGNRLNVKTCPYCNLHYTLCIEDFNSKDALELMTKFQFDHFIDKAEYPILSMSLYNLIPSCPTCNMGKSQEQLTLDFHPYYSDICKTFKFAVKNPTKLYEGSVQADEEIELVETNGVDIAKYDRVFHIKKLYMRHKDVMQDIFARAYEEIYYSNNGNFGFLNNADLSRRVKIGFFPDEKDINLRPMTKFQQDLWFQAQGVKLWPNP